MVMLKEIGQTGQALTTIENSRCAGSRASLEDPAQSLRLCGNPRDTQLRGAIEVLAKNLAAAGSFQLDVFDNWPTPLG